VDVYNTLLLFGEDGDLIGRHRKLVPTGGERLVWPGGSAIIDPKGNVLAGPVNEREEIVFADVDLDAARGTKWDLDTAGHYARPDIFELTIDREPRVMIRERESSKPGAANRRPRRTT
jgi:nitrilase